MINEENELLTDKKVVMLLYFIFSQVVPDADLEEDPSMRTKLKKLGQFFGVKTEEVLFIIDGLLKEYFSEKESYNELIRCLEDENYFEALNNIWFNSSFCEYIAVFLPIVNAPKLLNEIVTMKILDTIPSYEAEAYSITREEPLSEDDLKTISNYIQKEEKNYRKNNNNYLKKLIELYYVNILIKKQMLKLKESGDLASYIEKLKVDIFDILSRDLIDCCKSVLKSNFERPLRFFTDYLVSLIQTVCFNKIVQEFNLIENADEEDRAKKELLLSDNVRFTLRPGSGNVDENAKSKILETIQSTFSTVDNFFIQKGEKDTDAELFGYSFEGENKTDAGGSFLNENVEDKTNNEGCLVLESMSLDYLEEMTYRLRN